MGWSQLHVYVLVDQKIKYIVTVKIIQIIQINPRNQLIHQTLDYQIDAERQSWEFIISKTDCQPLMSVISTHRNTKLEHNSRSLYLQRKLSPSLKKTTEEVREQSYLDHLNDAYIKNWNEMKRNNETIVNIKMERERLRTLIDYQKQQLSSSQSSLLKEEFTLEIQRLSEELLRLYQIRQKQDEDLTISKQLYLRDYQHEIANNLRLQGSLQKCGVQLQLYRNILAGKQVAVKLLQSKVAANCQKIKLKVQYQNKYKQIMGSKCLG